MPLKKLHEDLEEVLEKELEEDLEEIIEEGTNILKIELYPKKSLDINLKNFY